MRDFNETSSSVDNEKVKSTHRIVIKLATGEQITVCMTANSKYNGKVVDACIAAANTGKDLTALLKVAMVSATSEVLTGVKSGKSTPDVDVELKALLG